MPWFKVDDKFHDHRKSRAAKKAAVGVWTLAGSWCADNLMDGFVPRSVLSRWGTPADAKRLVDSGLWVESERDGEKGWQFLNWHEFQPSKAEVEAEREATKERVRAWREGKRRNGVSNAVTNGVSNGPVTEDVRPPRPVPSRPLTVVTTSSQSSSAPGGIDDDGLTRIKRATKGSDGHARKTAEFILAKAPADVRNPTAYVLAAISDDPDAYRYRRGNPKKGEECPTHAGQWADACAGCAADRKAAGA